MIEVLGLCKTYGRKVAVEDLSFVVRPGLVTGFLGPNGSGKSTTMRMIMGLDRPSAGRALVDGKPYRELPNPLGSLGAMIDAKAVHSGRSAHRHLAAIAATAGIPGSRVDEVIDMVGLRDVARKRAGGFSLGMGQRLGIAAALLADPGTIMLDEPVNGLDPDGILWIRKLVRRLASEGRAVLVSSHLMSEMALTADRLVVIGRGRLVADEDMATFLARRRTQSVVVRSPQPTALRDALEAAGCRAAPAPDGSYVVSDRTAEDVGAVAARGGVALSELTPTRPSLEDVYMQVTADAVEFAAGSPPAVGAAAPVGWGSPSDDSIPELTR